MSRIRILSEQLANQIAAGEVVERPASVVKELLENSVDAGASRIDIHVEGSGTGLLRVADNGEGMDGDDVLLCIERHATSKIKEEGQLAAIATLGFRGEAIPSIASVSWMTILSRPHTQELGTRAEIRYGSLRDVHEDGCARGTVIEIRHLFGNMPARKKFLKSARTEMHHIEEVVKNQALAHPRTGFTLHVDGRVVLEYQPEADLEQRLCEVFRYRGQLLPLREDGVGDDAEMGLEGFLLMPEMAPATNARLRILVNDRPVQDAMIRHAVGEGLQGFLMKGYQPAGALLLTIGPDQVDVNVHPAKREIRFRKSEAVHRFIVDRVVQAMGGYQQSLRTSLFTRPPSPQLPDRPVERREVASTVSCPPLTTAEPAAVQPRLPSLPATAPPFGLRPDTRSRQTQNEVVPGTPPIHPIPAEEYSGLTLIGQLFSLYLLCEKDGQFMVIDQHAAHERLLYGQLLQGYLEAKIPQQTLMFPVTVELTPVQADTLEQRGDQVAALGLQAESFGDTTYVIKSAPALVSHVDPGALLREILDGLRGPVRTDTGRPVPQAVDDLLASMACKAAIKAGNRLQPVEMLNLLAQMATSSVFSHCPHGRPVIKTFSVQEVERWFHRHGG
ncbi:DNA mismatch repair endonuclease MutL [uncultured Desulfobulbus sp.]|uniref:DNA mismatch repair endonuclease MutL n=1 Tax=uncultured Desulfobulbus sp. TaxID=239745 RepID=UPI0029C9A1A5|nr:DNA mismatch repair endonuclease MutL [uncultured Desulfobulbus sp.]